MTGLLKDMLHEQADAAPPPVIDPGPLMAAGRRQVRRSRMVAGLAAASVAGVVAAGTLVVPGLLDPPGVRHPGSIDGGAATRAASFSERRVGYADGSTIHWGGQAFDVGVPVTSYVQTDEGLVYTTTGGDVFFFDGTTSVEAGRTVTSRLRADDTGSTVAWLDTAEDGTPEYVVYDTALPGITHRVRQRTIPGPTVEDEPGQWDSGAEVYAVDDGSVYWRGTEAAIVRYDLSSATETVLFGGADIGADGSKPAVPYDVVDAAAGTLAFLVDAGDDAAGFQGADTTTLRVGRALDASAMRLPTGETGDLSPDGSRIVVEEADRSAVYDTRTGEVVPFATRGYAFAAGYGWQDDATVTVVGIRDLDAEQWDVDFLGCTVAGPCSVVDSLRVPARDGAAPALPNGDPVS